MAVRETCVLPSDSSAVLLCHDFGCPECQGVGRFFPRQPEFGCLCFCGAVMANAWRALFGNMCKCLEGCGARFFVPNPRGRLFLFFHYAARCSFSSSLTLPLLRLLFPPPPLPLLVLER